MFYITASFPLLSAHKEGMLLEIMSRKMLFDEKKLCRWKSETRLQAEREEGFETSGFLDSRAAESQSHAEGNSSSTSCLERLVAAGICQLNCVGTLCAKARGRIAHQRVFLGYRSQFRCLFSFHKPPSVLHSVWKEHSGNRKAQ